MLLLPLDDGAQNFFDRGAEADEIIVNKKILPR